MMSAEVPENLNNETRQLEGIAFPVGIAIGAIGAAIWPSIFPESTTTSTSTSSSSDDDIIDVIEDDIEDLFVGSSSSSTTQKTTTTVEPRTTLKNFPECGVKGSSNRVVGGSEVRQGTNRL